MDEAEYTLMVKGVGFEHGFNEVNEFYSHKDQNGWLWEVWRHKRDPLRGGRPTWFVSVAESKRNGRVQMLNTCLNGEDGYIRRKGPLYDLGHSPPMVFMENLIPLIEAGEWPEETVYDYTNSA